MKMCLEEKNKLRPRGYNWKKTASIITLKFARQSGVLLPSKIGNIKSNSFIKEWSYFLLAYIFSWSMPECEICVQNHT